PRPSMKCGSRPASIVRYGSRSSSTTRPASSRWTIYWRRSCGGHRWRASWRWSPRSTARARSGCSAASGFRSDAPALGTVDALEVVSTPLFAGIEAALDERERDHQDREEGDHAEAEQGDGLVV